ncbi:MAG: hypothetical protein LWW83_16095, partial [Azonexaceae bacterium]|nr:hypothetical protein [Azonexaceae bacterium]
KHNLNFVKHLSKISFTSPLASLRRKPRHRKEGAHSTHPKKTVNPIQKYSRDSILGGGARLEI